MLTVEALVNDLNEMLTRILNDHCFHNLKETTLQSDVVVDGHSIQQIQVLDEVE